MKILHRYLLKQYLRNLCVCLFVFCLLFLIFDFFDRIDNILPEDADAGTIAKYFFYKIPQTATLMIPVSVLVSTMFTVGILSKNSEITAMRATGATLLWLFRPIIAAGLFVGIISLALNETVVPYTTRRVKEIYNIDIMQKNRTGSYSQGNFWWRSNNDFYSVNMFDSRTNTLMDFSKFELLPDHSIAKRTEARRVKWIDPLLGWSMEDVTRYKFQDPINPEIKHLQALPLPISSQPQDFYDVKTEPDTMSFRQLRRFIREQAANGIPVTGSITDLQNKLAFPFASVVISLVVLPFSLKPARSGSLAGSFVFGLVIGFSYYAVHSFSLAMGRAELWPPMISAWMANILVGCVALILNLGAEAP